MLISAERLVFISYSFPLSVTFAEPCDVSGQKKIIMRVILTLILSIISSVACRLLHIK